MSPLCSNKDFVNTKVARRKSGEGTLDDWQEHEDAESVCVCVFIMSVCAQHRVAVNSICRRLLITSGWAGPLFIWTYTELLTGREAGSDLHKHFCLSEVFRFQLCTLLLRHWHSWKHPRYTHQLLFIAWLYTKLTKLDHETATWYFYVCMHESGILTSCSDSTFPSFTRKTHNLPLLCVHVCSYVPGSVNFFVHENKCMCRLLNVFVCIWIEYLHSCVSLRVHTLRPAHTNTVEL